MTVIQAPEKTERARYHPDFYFDDFTAVIILCCILNKNGPDNIRAVFIEVEMAGVEPASETFAQRRLQV